MRYHSNTYAKGVYDIYWFEKNLLGDIIAVYASRGTKLIEYNYYAYIRYQGKEKGRGTIKYPSLTQSVI